MTTTDADDAMIVINTKMDRQTQRYYPDTYIWEGSSNTVYIDAYSMRQMRHIKFLDGRDRIQVGPFQLRCIEDNYPDRPSRYIREDYPFWRVVVWMHKYKYFVHMIYSRSILTLAIWGLAEYNPAFVPSYRDIYFIRWIRKMLSANE